MKAMLAFLAVLYFDAHNHFTGILPYQAYANLPAYEYAHVAWHQSNMSHNEVLPY